MRIRFKANSGIYGLAASDENPHGEYPEGHEIDVDDIPEGWKSKVDIISGKPKDDAEMIVADAPRRGRPPVSKD